VLANERTVVVDNQILYDRHTYLQNQRVGESANR